MHFYPLSEKNLRSLRVRNFQLRHFHQTSQPSPSETRLEKNRANHGHLPDVILLDIQMPGMTGHDGHDGHLRKDESPRHVKKLSSGMWIILASLR